MTATSRGSSRSPGSTRCSRSTRPATTPSRLWGFLKVDPEVLGFQSLERDWRRSRPSRCCSRRAAATGGTAAASGEQPDLQNGQTLFSSPTADKQPSCASCHALQAAGSSGTIGPDLDNAFAGSRDEGYPSSTIENLVLDQIRLGSGPIATYTAPEHGVEGLTPQTPMPANLWDWPGRHRHRRICRLRRRGRGRRADHSFRSISRASLPSGVEIFKAPPVAEGATPSTTPDPAGTVGPNLDQIASALTPSRSSPARS